MQNDDVKYIKLVYNMMLEDLERLPEKLSWAKSVKVLLESLGFGHVWLTQGVGDVTMFLNVFKQRLTDNFIQGWNAEISNSSRGNTYSLIADFNFKCYLDFITIRKFRYAFTRLRVASHRLEIEAGRWHQPNRIPVEERKCVNCNSLEDEFHFLLECSLYQDLRQIYIKRYFWTRPNVPKFVELLQSDNKNIIKNLSVYIYKSFERRTELLSR